MEEIEAVSWSDTRVDYRRPHARSASIVLDQIQGKNLKDVHETEPVQLDSKIIDAASIMPSNYGGTSSLGWSYTGEFEKTTSKEEAFEKSFDQSSETYYEQGGDAAGFKAGIKITSGVSSVGFRFLLRGRASQPIIQLPRRDSPRRGRADHCMAQGLANEE